MFFSKYFKDYKQNIDIQADDEKIPTHIHIQDAAYIGSTHIVRELTIEERWTRIMQIGKKSAQAVLVVNIGGGG